MFVNHEQLNMSDRFGQVMMDNLASRGCDLPGAAACKDKVSTGDTLLKEKEKKRPCEAMCARKNMLNTKFKPWHWSFAKFLVSSEILGWPFW